MFNVNGEPLRIVVETVPHEVVARLDEKDEYLQGQITGLRGMLNEAVLVIRDLKQELQALKKNQ